MSRGVIDHVTSHLATVTVGARSAWRSARPVHGVKLAAYGGEHGQKTDVISRVNTRTPLLPQKRAVGWLGYTKFGSPVTELTPSLDSQSPAAHLTPPPR